MKLLRHARALIVTVLMLLMAAAAVPSKADEVEVIGFVESFTGPSSGYAIEQNGKSIPIAIFKPLHRNDRLIVRDPDGVIKIQLVGGKQLTVTHAQSPRGLVGEAAGITQAGSLLAEVGAQLTAWADWNTTVVSARIRGGGDAALDMPLIRHPLPEMAAGDRQLTLAWVGGTPPFGIRLVRNTDGDVVVDEQGLDHRRIDARDVAMTTGGYTIDIADGTGETLKRTFTVVDPPLVPAPPADLASEGMSADMRAAAAAAWLAGEDDGRWALEAFQQIGPLAESYEPARLLGQALIHGTFARP